MKSWLLFKLESAWLRFEYAHARVNQYLSAYRGDRWTTSNWEQSAYDAQRRLSNLRLNRYYGATFRRIHL